MTKDLPKVVIPFSTDYYFVKGGLPLVQSEDGTISVISHFRTESGQEVEIYHSRRVVVIKLLKPVPYAKAVEINEQHRYDLRVDGYAGGTDPQPEGVKTYHVDSSKALNTLTGIIFDLFGKPIDSQSSKPIDMERSEQLRSIVFEAEIPINLKNGLLYLAALKKKYSDDPTVNPIVKRIQQAAAQAIGRESWAESMSWSYLNSVVEQTQDANFKISYRYERVSALLGLFLYYQDEPKRSKLVEFEDSKSWYTHRGLLIYGLRYRQICQELLSLFPNKKDASVRFKHSSKSYEVTNNKYPNNDIVLRIDLRNNLNASIQEATSHAQRAAKVIIEAQDAELKELHEELQSNLNGKDWTSTQFRYGQLFEGHMLLATAYNELNQVENANKHKEQAKQFLAKLCPESQEYRLKENQSHAMMPVE